MTQILKASALLVILSGIFVDVQAMNDPYSYEHVKTSYWDMRDHLVVRTTFRGANGFGVVITDAAKARASLDGKILKILREK